MPAPKTVVPFPKPPGQNTRRHYRRRLANVKNVRTALADVLREFEGGRVNTTQTRTLIYGYSTLAGLIGSEPRKLSSAPTSPEAAIKAEVAAAVRGSRGRGVELRFATPAEIAAASRRLAKRGIKVRI